MNVIFLQSGVTRDLPADQMQEIRDIGFTYYRRVSDDLIEKMAIIRAAALILSDLAAADPDPQSALDGFLTDLRDEIAELTAADAC